MPAKWENNILNASEAAQEYQNEEIGEEYITTLYVNEPVQWKSFYQSLTPKTLQHENG